MYIPPILGALGAFFSITAFVLLWSSVYMLGDVLRLAELAGKRRFGSGGILLALPLGMLTAFIVSYNFITTGQPPPPEQLALAFSSMLLASLLILRPVYGLVRTARHVKLPGTLLLAYVIVYAATNMFFVSTTMTFESLAGTVMLAAELLLGASFILLSAYTEGFRKLDVKLGGKTFSTHYELSVFFLVAGLLVPMDTTIMAMGVHEVASLGSSAPADVLVPFRLLAQVVLTVAGLLALVGMVTFNRAVEEFCLRLGSLDALYKKEK